jgi:hypothetical protein
MQVSLNLAKLVGFSPAQRSGIIRDIAAEARLERHYVSDLLHGKASSISFEALASICEYLVKVHNKTPAELLGQLFVVSPGGFWDMFAGHTSFDLCFGMRRSQQWPERRWVSAADADLQASLLHRISLADTDDPDADTRGEGVTQHLIRSPEEKSTVDDLKEWATEVYDAFEKRGGKKSLIIMGSLKSNSVTELAFARAFKAQPFVSQDAVARARDRSCPIFYRYRDHDVQPPSCCGGVRLSKSEEAMQPGIYYEDPKKKQWVCCPVDSSHDAALVYYVNRPLLGRLELVMGGFSGIATLQLSSNLPRLAHEFWPPAYSTPNLQVGLYVVRMIYRDRSPGADRFDVKLEEIEVIPLAKSTLVRRLDRARRPRRIGRRGNRLHPR